MTSPIPIPPRPTAAPDDLPPNDLAPAPRPEQVAVGEMTFAEYLAFDESSTDRHEYVDGVVYAMSYGTTNHGGIAANLIAILRPGARSARCRVFSSTLRVLTPGGNSYVPDVMVDCGPTPPEVSLYREQPCLVIEVLSPSTRHIDLGEKSTYYRRIETLQAYWVVETTWRCVYRHWRDADGAWQYEEVTGDAVLPVPCPVAMTLTLDDLYEDTVDIQGARPPLRRVHEAGAEYVVAGAFDAIVEETDSAPALGD